MGKAKEFLEKVDTSNGDINGLVAEFTKHASDALSALSKIQTTTAQSGKLTTSIEAKELIDEFSKFWKKSEYFRKKYRKA